MSKIIRWIAKRDYNTFDCIVVGSICAGFDHLSTVQIIIIAIVAAVISISLDQI